VTLGETLAKLAEPLAVGDHPGDPRPFWDRLDAVVGRDRWCDDYHSVGAFVACRLRVEFGDKQSIVRVGCAETPDQAFERAALKLGIGRDGAAAAEPPETKFADTAPAAAPHLPSREDGRGRPTSGKGLFRWAKRIEEDHHVGMVKYLNEWAKLQGEGAKAWPFKMVEWNAGQVEQGVREALRKLASQGITIADPPSSGQVDMTGPVGIREGDPLGDLKRFIRAAGWQFARQRLGLPSSSPLRPQETLAEINRVSAEIKGDSIVGLTDLTNRLLLENILDHFNAETEALAAAKG
jgi:hypothetical protein